MADREFEERFEETWNDVSDIDFLRLQLHKDGFNKALFVVIITIPVQLIHF